MLGKCNNYKSTSKQFLIGQKGFCMGEATPKIIRKHELTDSEKVEYNKGAQESVMWKW
jgi:hypothetical protein